MMTKERHSKVVVLDSRTEDGSEVGNTKTFYVIT